MEFELLDSRKDFAAWRALWRESASDFESFRGFGSQAARLFQGDYKLLKNRFSIQRYGVFSREAGRRKLMAVGLRFQARSAELGPESSLGGLLFHPELSRDQLRWFAGKIIDAAGPVSIAPLNGHVNLGLSVPAPGVVAESVTFMCAPVSRQTHVFFHETGHFEKTREQYALMTPVTEELGEKVRAGTAEAERKGFGSRPLSVLRYKRDVAIYNALVNAAMKDHPNFYPLSFEEEWDLLREALAVFQPSWFRFLTYEGREIGFCFAFPDYNSGLRSDRSDALNALTILAQRARGRFARARLVYSGIHPDFKGQGLFKAVRHAVIAEMISAGVKEFESSYVDEANAASLANVKSTGGRVSHSFGLFRSI